jgi:RNA polymerase sigma-54 factor
MAITQKLQARLSQKLILTPSLQQAIKLLPMTTLELAELLNQEMVENPMLEEVQPDEVAAKLHRHGEPAKVEEGQRHGTTPISNFSASISTISRHQAAVEARAAAHRKHALVARIARFWQLPARHDLIRDIGAAIVGNIDDDGYLMASLDEIAALGDSGCRMSSGRSRTFRRSIPLASAHVTCRSACCCS